MMVMKYLVILLFICLLTTPGLFAQTTKKSDPQVFTGAAAGQELPGPELQDVGSTSLYIQIGNGIPYGYKAENGASYSVHFPWDVLYIPYTFAENNFEVSRGYYSDRIQIDWTIQSNADLIERIVVYRRPYTGTHANDTEGYTSIATLPADAYTYKDTNIQGGKLYEYKIVAVGASVIEKKYITYITGIGYRNPTGVVTGNITFDGGSPVKDAVIRADPQGADLSFGSSLLFTNTSKLSIPLWNQQPDNAITWQAWLKLQKNTSASLFQLQDTARTSDILEAICETTDNSLTVTVSLSSGQSKTFSISNFYPTGNVDGKGDDSFNAFTTAGQPQTDFDQNFVHLSVVLKNGAEPLLYLNGRNVDEDYVDKLPGSPLSIPSVTTSGSFVFAGFHATEAIVGEGLMGSIDEVRLWNTALDEKRIRTDFKRYLGGTEVNLISYLRCDEKAGSFAYDISRRGFDFNKNHAEIINGTWSDDKPTSSQLGILGVTDEQGNYIIASIPYAGTGESYALTPMLGVHQFEPAQQLVYIGNGSEVVNQVKFRDISSFRFLGTVYYTSDGVFPTKEVPGVEPGTISEDGYNQYKAQIDDKEQAVSKGEYYWDKVSNKLHFTPKIFVEGANVYVDGNIVLDKDKRPVVTGPDGKFDIQVPIGNHYIEVKKDKHHFKHGGRFPAGQDLFEFFQHQQTSVTFLDTTRVQLAGRVVGGTREAAKPVGFGYAGPHKYAFKRTGKPDSLVTVSSSNNVGIASLTLNYLPYGGTPGVGEVKYTFESDSLTGEYKVSVLPLSYVLNQNGVRIKNNPAIQLLTANEILNLSTVPDTIRSEYKDGDQVVREKSEPYHFVKSFTYRSDPTLNTISQSSDDEVAVTVKGADGTAVSETIATTGLQTLTGDQYLFYTQGKYYTIRFETYEEYVNNDNDEKILTDRVPITDGQFIINNNLAEPGTTGVTEDENNSNVRLYTFRAGLPAIAAPFTRNISIKYRVNDVDYPATNYNPQGVIFGGASDGSQTFVSVMPDVPDIILRDPPGSNSFASIEAGQSISFTSEYNYSAIAGAGASVESKFGMELAFVNAPMGIGTIEEASSVFDVNVGVKVTNTSNDGRSLTTTYEFSNTISTSDDPLYVGSDGDIYIGKAQNYFYGTYNRVQADKNPISGSDYLTLKDPVTGKQLHISTQKAYYLEPKPTGTVFVYSQHFLLNTLLPELESIITGLENGTIPSSGPSAPPLTKRGYEQQVKQWKKVIYENEKTKYNALNNRNAVREALIDSLNVYVTSIASQIDQGLLAPDKKQQLAEFLNNAKEVRTLVDKKFYENISFDAGVGEITKSVLSSSVVAAEKSFEIEVDEEFATSTGFDIKGAGITVQASQYHTSNISGGLNKEQATITTIRYTLKDNDANNYFSVDVVNAFDGNGPVFSTLGGRSSCPYEGAELTEFYSYRFNNSKALFYLSSNPVVETWKETLSKATQQIQKPEISVEVASVVNVPEAEAAEFTLILENNNPAGVDGLSSYFDLWVDNTTNPNNAIMNVGTTGTSDNLYVPYGKQTKYTLTLQKSAADVFEYKNIKVYLLSGCEPSVVYDSTTISATFSPSCTAVQLNQPLNNWVVNADGAINVDNTTNPLPVQISNYNQSFANFKNFELQYRKSTSSSWTTLGSYYNSQALLDAAVLEGKTGVVINGATTVYPWDIGAMGLADGKYELRAISYCSNGTQFLSDVVTGTVDLNVPKPFGTPSPADGILGPGEDITMRFNEPILYSSALSRIQIKGETNQQKINHNVSIHFEGAANTVAIEKPNIVIGDLSIEFWMQNQTTGTATLMSQPGTLSVTLNNGTMIWTLGANTVQGTIASDGLFHHYTLTYQDDSDEMRIYQDATELGYLANANGLTSTSSNSLTIGGNTFVGNLHDLRLWAKSLSLPDAYAAQYNELMGTERNLLGYWPMNEGHGIIANDLARYKHATVNAQWDIKPKTTAYEFINGQYLELDDVNFVQLTRDMDVTLSFWIKTSQQGVAAIFSNGRGNGEDPVQSDGRAGKWSVDMQDGILYLRSEGQSYKLTSTVVNDDRWHHIAIVLRRLGTLRTFVDAAQVSSQSVTQIGGLQGNKFWIGARGFVNSINQTIVDQKFTGKIDELQLWKLARATEQIDRDMFSEVDFNSLGLMLYARMNEPVPVVATGPAYYHVAANAAVLSTAAKLSDGTVKYTKDSPGIRPVREYLNFNVTHVINGDEIILTPDVTDWSVLEGRIIDITVADMYDQYGNQQRSPVTWSAYVRRNEVIWYVTEEGVQTLSLEKPLGETRTFEITLRNKGGRMQPYNIDNIPAWLSAKGTSGTLQPNSMKTLKFEISPELTIGEYAADLLLDTDFNFDEKILLNVRVLGEAPEWTMDPSKYEYSMNIIGKVKIDGVFSNDPYTKIAAFAGEEIRGVANLEYDENYDEHFVYLNIFSNTSSEEAVTFKIWDAATGKVYQATMNGDLSFTFIQNEVVGVKSAPVIFENTSYIEQSIALNAGWTWISLYAEDEDLSNLNALTSTLNLNDNDHIKGQLYFDVYDHGTGWTGTLSSNGGLTTSSMYKVRLAHANTLMIGGDETNLSTWKADVHAGWNWLAYPLTTNVSVNEALALLNAKEGDVVKNQKSFAIYDPMVGWSGTLRYLMAGEGYMLKAGSAQEFHYPDVFSNAKSGRTKYDLQPGVEGWQTYEHNMNIVGEVVGDGEYDSVFVMDKQGVIRGKSELVKHNGKRLSYITVFGNSGEEETLFFWLSNNHSTVPADKNFNFSPDMIMGNIQEPVKLSASSEFVMTVYPNMFSNELILQFHAQREQQTEIKLLDRVGRVVYAAPVSINKGHNRIEVHPDVDSGLYILTTVVDGQKQTFKVIRK